MSDTNVSVQFSAETSDLIGKIAVAKVQVQQFSAEIKALATQMVAAGTTGNAVLKAALGGIATDALTAKTSLASMEVELKGIGGATPAAASLGEAIKKTGTSAHGAGAGIAFYTREAHAMLDELSSGRIQQFQGTFLNVAFTFLQANTALIPFAAGILALGGTLAYVAYQAYAYSAALASIKLDAAIADIAMTDAQSKKLLDTIRELGHVGAGHPGNRIDGEGHDLLRRIMGDGFDVHAAFGRHHESHLPDTAIDQQ